MRAEEKQIAAVVKPEDGPPRLVIALQNTSYATNLQEQHSPVFTSEELNFRLPLLRFIR